MDITAITVCRSVKISTGNYENTDVSVELSGTFTAGEDKTLAAVELINRCDAILKIKIDEIELGKRSANSKASRFGV